MKLNKDLMKQEDVAELESMGVSFEQDRGEFICPGCDHIQIDDGHTCHECGYVGMEEL